MSSRFADMVAIVLGGADNIGRATAAMLARGGARVVIGYRSNAAGAEDALREIGDQGGEAMAVRVDHSQEQDVAELVRRTVEAFGTINILVNNAALVGAAQREADLDVVRMDVEHWDEAMAVNLRGPMLACKHSIPHMIRAGYGSIINTGTGAVFKGDSVRTAYSASKNGLHALTLNIATAYGKQNVRCNLVAPGLVMTRTVVGQLDKASIAGFTEQNLVPFVGEPDDIAHVTCFLASREARYVTGQIITVDGGMLVHQCTIGRL